MPLSKEESSWVVKTATEAVQHEQIRSKSNQITLKVYNTQLERLMREKADHPITDEIRNDIEQLRSDLIDAFPQILGLRNETAEKVYTEVIHPISAINLNKAI